MVETGPDVRSVKVGDLVLVSSVAGCGTCVGCATRDPITCLSGPQIFGSGVLGGAQSDLLAVPAADFQLLTHPGRYRHRGSAAADRQSGHRMGRRAARRHPARRHGGGVRTRCGRPVRGEECDRAGRRQVFAVDPVEGRRDRAARLGATPLEPPALGCGTGGDRGSRCGIGDRRGRQRHHHDRGADLCASRRYRLGDRRPQPQPVPVPGDHEPGAQYVHADDHRPGATHLARTDPADPVGTNGHQRHIHRFDGTVRCRRRPTPGWRRGRRTASRSRSPRERRSATGPIECRSATRPHCERRLPRSGPVEPRSRRR